MRAILKLCAIKDLLLKGLFTESTEFAAVPTQQ